MAALICSTLNPIHYAPSSLSQSSKKRPAQIPISAIRLGAAVRGLGKKKKETCNKRGELVVVRAGPSTTSYIFAFVFPLSLIIVTVIASFRIADKLDQQYLEELAMNEAIMEEKEEDDDGEEEAGEDGSTAAVPAEEKIAAVEAATAPRARNRPKREV